MDIELYISGYSGIAKVNRLLDIALKRPELANECYNLAYTHLKDTENVAELSKVASKLGLSIDLSSLKKKCDAKTEKLEQELKHAKHNMISENIRICLLELSDHYVSTGNLDEALKCLNKSKEYCTSQAHITEMCLKAVQVCINMGNFGPIHGYAYMARSGSDLNSASASKISLSVAIAYIVEGDFKRALDTLLTIKFESSTFVSEISNQNDLTMYIALCALASLNREEIRTKVLENSEVKQFLQLDISMKSALENYVNSQFSSCIEILKKKSNDLALDIFFGPVIAKASRQIEEKMLISYVNCFSFVDLKKTCKIFGIAEEELEKKLVDLIFSNAISFRINSEEAVARFAASDEISEFNENISRWIRANEINTAGISLMNKFPSI